ncbi:MAG: hypothetical protein JW745_01555 [Sedimentisphaerales bacterium]|nr:hypothetical protein [Sedimentisphaerales bacterium]MBN2843616.1 hypothetical protein [Sedimentisphaerales bacterium]
MRLSVWFSGRMQAITIKVRPIAGLAFFCCHSGCLRPMPVIYGFGLLQYFDSVSIWVWVGVCLAVMWLFCGFSGVIWSVIEVFSGLMIFGRVFIYVTIHR